MCLRCHESQGMVLCEERRLHILGGGLPRGCQECCLSLDQLNKWSNAPTTRVYVVPEVGVYRVLCAVWKDAYRLKRAVAGTEQPGTLTPGTTIGRYGSEKGSFASQPGASYQSLSLPYDPGVMPYREYEVMKPLDYSGGDIAPWFDQPGGATQYRFGQSVQSLI